MSDWAANGRRASKGGSSRVRLWVEVGELALAWSQPRVQQATGGPRSLFANFTRYFEGFGPGTQSYTWLDRDTFIS